MSTSSSNPADGGPRRAVKLAGKAFAYGSLLCSISPWVALVFYYTPGVPKLNLTGFDWFRIMAVAVVLSGAAAVCSAKLWKVALPVALTMFFFVMYVMGT